MHGPPKEKDRPHLPGWGTAQFKSTSAPQIANSEAKFNARDEFCLAVQP